MTSDARRRSGLTTVVTVAVLSMMLGGAGPTHAQGISGASATTAGSTANSGDTSGSTRSSVAVQTNTAAQVKTRFAWNVSADVAVFSTRDQQGLAIHNVAFNVTAPGAYFLTVDQNRAGMVQVNNDAVNCEGAADTGAISGSQSGGTLTSGSLGMSDPGGVANTSSTTQIPFNQNGTARIDATSNGVAQAHTLQFSWNGSVRSNSCEAAVRQGEGSSVSSCAACEYPGSPARTQATDGHFVTVSFTSLCGNSTVDGAPGEQCDLGGSNGASTSCCTSSCQFRAGGEVCRAQNGQCDVADACTGSDGTCPADGKSTALCRAAADDCDVAESCNGVSNTCPANQFVPSTVECRPVSDVCDVAESCTGTGPSCPTDQFAPSTQSCRGSNGVCDLAEFCPGDFPSCPPDSKSSDECRGVAGVCDVAEFCDGVNDDCPGDVFEASTLECRGAAGVCDIAESCTGSSASCPADAKSTALCRGVAGDCDVADSCDGVSNDCPADAFQPSTLECRGSAGDCDVADNCTGSSAVCPPDAFQPSTFECRAAAGVCDVAESCTGSSATCPADVLAASSVECRASAGDCDVAETCTGDDVLCPSDAVQPGSHVCRPSAGDCDVPENCDGSSVTCPTDGFATATQVCRPDTGDCDVAETCTGAGADCPADVVEPDGSGCNDSNTCTISDACAGGACIGDSNICGDGVVQGGCNEECDDGGTDPDDGCSPTCQNEFGRACDAGPASGCIQPFVAGKAQIQIKNKTPDTGDQLKWKWIKGSRTTVLDFGTPTTTTAYQLCLWDQGGLELSANIPADRTCDGKPCWSPIGAKGFKYKDKSGTPDGITQVQLKEGQDGKAKILVKGKGANLDDPNLATLVQPVTVQLQNSIGECWEAVYSAPPSKQQPDQFQDKAD